MTRKEIIQRDFASYDYVVGPEHKGGVSGCPHDYGLGPTRYHNEFGCKGCSDDLCTFCWNEEVKENEYEAYVENVRNIFGKEL